MTNRTPADEGFAAARRDNERARKREVLEEILEKMDECARMLRSLKDEHINAYCLAAFEGRDHGWLGHFERDIIQEALDALDDDEDDES